MKTKALSTKDRLIRSAATLFRVRGYHGVGLNDLLAHANAPKGSLYHHFPDGKPDLARASAIWASDQMLRLIAVSFEDADSFEAGLATLCHKLAKLFDLAGKWDGCPISAILFEGPENDAFRAEAERLFNGWIAEGAEAAERFGANPEEARLKSERMFVLIQGGWTLARARRSSDVLRQLPALLG
jgi:AcrR family transcriptional regulator